MSERPRRVAVVVLGMHRSATSALTRVIGHLGGDLAAGLAEAAESGGPGGNWEARAMTLFDERVLAAAGSAWDEPVELPAGSLEGPEAASLLEEGIELFDREYGDAPLPVIKDPRISRMVPFWSAILERRNVEPRFALMIRHPLEVAGSLAERNSFPAGKSILLWLRYLLDAERDTQGRRRAFVTYDGLLEDWRGTAAGLRSALDLPLAEPSPAGAAEIDGFLSPSLRHHRHEGEPGSEDSPADRWAAEAHRALAAAAGGDEEGLAALDAIRAELAVADEAFRPALRVERRLRVEAEQRRRQDREARRAAQRRAEQARERARRAQEEARRASARAGEAERALATVHNSRSWRLTGPLRGLPRLRGGRRGEAEQPPPAPFVVGVGRSGTTLLRLMLDAHPDLAIPPETRFLPRLIRAARNEGASAEDVVAVLTAERNWADFGLEADAVLARLRAAPGVTPAAAARAFYGAYAARFGKSRWGDKTPPYGRRMPMIATALPEARFVHVIRDVRDVAASWKRFRESRGDDPLTAGHWAETWSTTIVETRVKANEVPHYLEVRYEDLVSDPEPALRSICDLIDLDYDERMLSYHLSADQRLAELREGLPAAGDQPARSGADRISPHELATQPPRPDRVGAWRETLSEAEIREVEEVAGELLDEVAWRPVAG